jgi:hypothetical protein
MDYLKFFHFLFLRGFPLKKMFPFIVQRNLDSTNFCTGSSLEANMIYGVVKRLPTQSLQAKESCFLVVKFA